MSLTRSNTLIQLFAKAPIKGRVKTRLQPILSQDEIILLYQEMMTRILDLVVNLPRFDVHLWVDIELENKFIHALKSKYKLPVSQQQGGDLGEKMAFALKQGLVTHRKVILLGVDCVSVDRDYLIKAASTLDHEALVIGPAEDGGYVLLGATQLDTEIFENIQWGSSQVLLETVEILKRKGISYHLLDTRWDLDRPEDLARYRSLEF